jgi:hypothetical protein
MKGNEMPKVQAKAQLRGLGAPEIHVEAPTGLSVGSPPAVADGTVGSTEFQLTLSL